MNLHRYSIPLKFFMLLLPMVSLPIAIVGYWSYQTSVNSVTKLSREHQLLQARGAAQQIDNVLRAGINNLDILSQLIDDLPDLPKANAVAAPSDYITPKMGKLIQHMLTSNPYFFQIKIIDHLGKTFFAVYQENTTDAKEQNDDQQNLTWINNDGNRESFHISSVLSRKGYPGYYIQIAKPFLNQDEQFSGAVTLSLNFTKMIQFVKTIRIGKEGYGFLVDESGRTIAHPHFNPYEYDLTRYDDPNLREFVIRMLSGETGWKTFKEQGEKAAAFAPVQTTGWSLAVSIPIEEFKRDAQIHKKNVIQVVMVMILLSTIIITYISYFILRSLRNLVLATEQVAEGDLSREIPVQSRDELGMLTESFNKMIRSLRGVQRELVASEKLISLGRLSAGVAHEIRNPLNAMKGAITYLQRKKSEDDTVIEFTDIILEEVNRLNEFVSDFLVYAKQSEPRKSPTDINDLLQSALTLFQSEFETKKITVTLQLDESLPAFSADTQQLQQVFLNIFINSLDAMQSGGKMLLKTSYVDDDTHPFATVTVKDNGVGIASKDMAYIFDPFFSTKDTGTGLGLPISKSIIENHGGEFLVDSTVGKSTTVTIRLPLSDN